MLDYQLNQSSRTDLELSAPGRDRIRARQASCLLMNRLTQPPPDRKRPVRFDPHVTSSAPANNFSRTNAKVLKRAIVPEPEAPGAAHLLVVPVVHPEDSVPLVGGQRGFGLRVHGRLQTGGDQDGGAVVGHEPRAPRSGFTPSVCLFNRREELRKAPSSRA